jgi:hypothetical protein
MAMAVEDAREVLADLRRARRRQRTVDFDMFEALYRAYLTGIFAGIAVLLLSGATGDGKVAAGTLVDIRRDGPAVVGAALALAVAIGLRSGGRGGPLVIEAAEVRHVLLAPVDRTVALRGPAIRQLRFGTLIGAGVGALAGLLAYRRLPGVPGGWVAFDAVVVALGAAASFGVAMIVSGLRWGRLVAGTLALALLGWSTLDIGLNLRTSPFTWLGALALWPLTVRPLALIGVVVALLLVVGGLAFVGGTSLEAAERRASLVGQLRFAATLQDLRTVVVLRRQLALERPRMRPWIPLRRRGRLTSWRRGWHGILRWPGVRIVRLVILGGVAGVALVGTWRGTTPLVVLGGLALYVAALDAVEPLAQEMDHPDRLLSFPHEAGHLHLRALAAPGAAMLLPGAVGFGVVAAASLGDPMAMSIAAIVAVPAVLAAAGGAAVSVVKGPPPPLTPQQAIFPEATGMRSLGRLLWPPAIAIIGVLPALAAKAADDAGHAYLPPLLGAEAGVVVLLAGIVAWVRWQEDAHVWWDGVVAQLFPSTDKTNKTEKKS